MGQRVSKLPAKLLDRSIANALNRVSAFDERNQILEAEIYDDLLPARSHVLLRLLLELIERADEELPRGVEVERSSQTSRITCATARIECPRPRRHHQGEGGIAATDRPRRSRP